MEFVHPALLAGAALAAVPIILHLVMRQKPQHLEFPALRFLKQRREANRRRMRLRHWLLLLLRVAALMLLALALARPSLKATGGIADQDAPVRAVFVFDTSPRMQYRQQNQTRLEQAQEMSLWLLSQLPAESQVAAVDSQPGPGVFQIDLGAARQRIERLETVSVAQPLISSIEEAVRLLEEPIDEGGEIYVFTDLSQAAWTDGSAERLRASLADDDGVVLYVIDVGVEEPQNFALGELDLSGQIVSRNSPLRVATNLAATGQGGARSVELYLVDRQGELQKRYQEDVELAEGESAGIEFPLSGLDEGTHQGLVRIAGADGLAIDDERYFTVEVKPVWPVLVAASEPATSKALYLTEALAPEAFRRNGLARFRCDVVPIEQLGETALEAYAAVCLLDPPPLSSARWQQLTSYANSGGGVALFLGRQAASDTPFAEGAAAELVPGRLADAPNVDTYLVPEETPHPVWDKFRALEGDVPWDLFPVYRYWLLGELAEGSTVLARYRDGGPALIERSLGRGRVLTMTTPISDAANRDPWNLLPTGFDAWPFVMLSNELLLYLVGSADGQLNYQVGEVAVLPMDDEATGAAYVLSTPTGDEFRRSIDARQQAIVVTTTDWPGQYRVRAGGREGGFDRGFSVNLPTRYSELERLDRDALGSILGDATYQVARGREEIDREIRTGRVGRELFGLIILLVAALLALEHFGANRFYRDDQAAAGETVRPSKAEVLAG